MLQGCAAQGASEAALVCCIIGRIIRSFDYVIPTWLCEFYHSVNLRGLLEKHPDLAHMYNVIVEAQALKRHGAATNLEEDDPASRLAALQSLGLVTGPKI